MLTTLAMTMASVDTIFAISLSACPMIAEAMPMIADSTFVFLLFI